MKIEIQSVPLEQKPIWRNLYPLYQFEESQWWPCPMNPFGVFDERPDIQNLAQGADWCDRFWEGDGWRPLWILADKEVAGLAVVAGKETGYIAAHVDYELLDFWILPRFRGRGIETEAASQTFGRGSHGHDWKVFAFENNIADVRFWRHVLGEVKAIDVREEQSTEFVNWTFRLATSPNLNMDFADE